jgi:hypothetical protein
MALPRWLLGVAVAAVACSPPAPPAPPAPAPGGWRTFEGTWTAAGERRTLEFAPGRTASVLDISGSILLTGDRGLGVGFQGRAIAFTDGTPNGVGRAVWTDERGDRIFSELHGAAAETGQRVRGTITGGTGRWDGITGEYSFDWRYFVEDEGRAQGRAVGLRGRARIVPPEGAR